MTRVRFLCTAGAIATVSLVAPAAASAHEGTGTIEVVEAEPAATLEIRYTARLTYDADGHPAEDATLTVVAADGSGSTTTPVPMEPAGEPGVYAATVRFPEPGPWTVRFTAVTPPATLELPVTIDATEPSAATTAPTSTAAPGPGTTEAGAAPTADGDGGSGSSAAPWIAGALLVIAAAAVAFVLARRRRS